MVIIKEREADFNMAQAVEMTKLLYQPMNEDSRRSMEPLHGRGYSRHKQNGRRSSTLYVHQGRRT